MQATPHIWIISDLHLCESRPTVTQAFLNWLKTVASQGEALYILGDLFEYWIGDDAAQPLFITPIIQALKQLSATGVSVYLMHGNRDFLIGEGFTDACGITLLQDPYLITWRGHQMLLSHGDALCTDDVAYQQFRDMVRQPDWQRHFLGLTIAERQAYADKARGQSEHDKHQKSMMIMDVNLQAVDALLSAHNYPAYLIHGHTHRPARHSHQSIEISSERLVLGDWHDHAVCIRVDEAHGPQLVNVKLA